MKKIFVVGIFSTLFMSAVFADQAMVLTSGDAEAAVGILKEETTILAYCEPCSDRKRNVVTIKSVDRVRFKPNDPNDDQWIVRVNGKEIDLAYTFFKRDGAWENLAMLFNIDVVDVSHRLPLKEKKSRTRK